MKHVLLRQSKSFEAFHCARQVNVDYQTRLGALERFILVKFEDDTIVIPRESEWFGWFAAGQDETVVPFNQTESNPPLAMQPSVQTSATLENIRSASELEPNSLRTQVVQATKKISTSRVTQCLSRGSFGFEIAVRGWSHGTCSDTN